MKSAPYPFLPLDDAYLTCKEMGLVLRECNPRGGESRYFHSLRVLGLKESRDVLNTNIDETKESMGGRKRDHRDPMK